MGNALDDPVMDIGDNQQTRGDNNSMLERVPRQSQVKSLWRVANSRTFGLKYTN